MSNSSRTACSLAPAYFHHWRSKARISRSRRVRLGFPIMTVRPILVVGDPVLHTVTRPVTTFDGELRSLVKDMFDTMEAADGVGLAANQVGVDLRLFVYDCPDDYGLTFRGVVANPVLETSE